ncbi:MAG: phage tail tube protein, partial [archaeon]|nr:phage tail tube protein [archaeon]
MARLFGDNNNISFRWDSGQYAVASGTRQWVGAVQSIDVDEQTNIIPTRYLGTGTRNVSQWIDGAKDVSFSLSYFPQDWRMLVTALGSNVDGGSPSPYTHVISEINSGSASPYTSGTMNPFTSYNLETSAKGAATGENFIRNLNGCMTNSWTLNASQGEIISVDVEGMAQDVVFTSGAITAPTEDTTRPFLWRDVKV